MDILNKIRNSGLKQGEIANILGVSDSIVSMYLKGTRKPTRHMLKLMEAYFGERKPYENPKIEAVARIMEELDAAAQEDILRIAEKEKRLQSIEREPERKAA